jgi:hypothetical protein
MKRKLKNRPHVSELDACPKCGSTEGYFYKMLVHFDQHRDFQGDPTGTSELMPSREGDVAFCSACQRAIANT